MKRIARKQGSMVVALVAACVLVAQSFLAAWAAGAMPHSADLDAFGNPLCITSDGHGGGPAGAPGGTPASLPDCCAPGCGMASALLAVPNGDGPSIALRTVRSEALLLPARTVAASSPGHAPQNPRAPPLTA